MPPPTVTIIRKENNVFTKISVPPKQILLPGRYRPSPKSLSKVLPILFSPFKDEIEATLMITTIALAHHSEPRVLVGYGHADTYELKALTYAFNKIATAKVLKIDSKASMKRFKHVSTGFPIVVLLPSQMFKIISITNNKLIITKDNYKISLNPLKTVITAKLVVSAGTKYKINLNKII